MLTAGTDRGAFIDGGDGDIAGFRVDLVNVGRTGGELDRIRELIVIS